MKRSLAGLFLLINCIYSYADSIQSLDLIKSKIEAYVLQELVNFSDGRVVVKVERMDSRLHLKHCADEHLNVFNPYNTPILSTSTMGIKCLETQNHWTLYVPIRINFFKEIYAAKQPLLKGTRISSEDIYQVEMDVQLLKQGYYIKADQLVGHVTKQPIAQGVPFAPHNVQLPALVRKGQQVSILAGTDNFTVRMSGVALNDGVLGDIVDVKNLSSKRIVEASISGVKEVRVTY